MPVTFENVKALIRANISDRCERVAATRPMCGFESTADEMRAFHHWSDVCQYNRVLRQLLDMIESMEGQG